MAAEDAAKEADAAVDLHALERDVGGLALDDAWDVEDDDAGSFGSDEEAPPDAFLSLQMVRAKHFPPDSLRDEAEDAESLASAVAGLEHVRLDRCGLVSLRGRDSHGPGSSTQPVNAPADAFSTTPLLALRNVSSLYLQKNRLRSLGGAVDASTTPFLRFLALSDNALTFSKEEFAEPRRRAHHPLSGLETLPFLMYLDCSGNAALDGVAALLETLPSRVAFCDFSRCAVSSGDEYRPALVASFDALKQLDGVAVTSAERAEARALLGETSDVSSDEASDVSSSDAEARERNATVPFDVSGHQRDARGVSSELLEAELESELADLERETRAVRAALDDVSLDADLGDEAKKSVALAGALARGVGVARPARLPAQSRAADRAAARLEATRDALVDVEARVRHAKKQTQPKTPKTPKPEDAGDASPCGAG